MMDFDENNISERRMDKIKYEILRLEDENAKTKNYTSSEMVDKIKQIIKDAADGKNV